MIGDFGQPEDFHRELVRHDVTGKSSNVYESIADEKDFFPKFKEKIIEENDTNANDDRVLKKNLFGGHNEKIDLKNLTTENKNEVQKLAQEIKQMQNNVSNVIPTKLKEPQTVKNMIKMVGVPKCSNQRGI